MAGHGNQDADYLNGRHLERQPQAGGRLLSDALHRQVVADVERARDTLKMVAIGLNTGRIKSADLEILLSDGPKRVSALELAVQGVEVAAAALAALNQLPAQEVPAQPDESYAERMRAYLGERGVPAQTIERNLAIARADEAARAQVVQQAAVPQAVAWRRWESKYDGWVYYETKAWDDLSPLYATPSPQGAAAAKPVAPEGNGADQA